MRFFISLLGVTLAAGLSAQTMLPAAQWCAAGKKFQSPTPPPNGAPDTRSDSIDIRETNITLDISNFSSQQIAGNAAIKFAAKVNGVSEIRLDLLNMTIDSVVPLPAAAWSYEGSQITAQLPVPLDSGQNATLIIYYHGKPVQDASTWGGFYWQGEYAYNLGVGFAADPHTFGRAWFPCFDNFAERCAFRFRITTPAGRPAYCNGYLQNHTQLPNGKIERTWVLDDEIPSYLACVAAGPFSSFKREYPGEAGPVPVEIAVAPADSTKLKGSFLHLPDALAAFEHWYGPFRWDKIGYSVVPFNQGAMEHATNIAYMRSAVDGTTGSETLMAHELSHHWWGDLATCSTAEDMWLNEGWAVYSEHLFLERVYGPARFRDAVETNFLNVLERTHVSEGGYRAVSGLPHELTYGEHVYNKGAAVAHNLRGYLGDSLFRAGIRTALEQNQFNDWSSAGLRDRLGAATGQNLDDFFNDWVFSPGFTHFSVDSFTLSTGPVDTFFIVTVYVKQKLRGAPHLYQNVPLEWTFVNDNREREYRTAVVSGENSTVQFHFPLSFLPVRTWVNTRQRLTLARAEKELLVKQALNYSFSPAKASIKVNSAPADSILVRVEHHYAMPDTAGAANPNGYRLSNRYWTVDMLPNADLDGDFSVFYDGRGKLDQLDTELFAQTGPSEDSLLLLYRPGPGYPWQAYPNTFKNLIGSGVDKYGLLRAPRVKPGQYTIGKGVDSVPVTEPHGNQFRATVSPNPGSGTILLNADERFDKIRVYSAAGELIGDFGIVPASTASLSTTDWPAGMYWIVLYAGRKTGAVKFQKVK